MEHSYLGDLEVYLICPTGKKTTIINSYNIDILGSIPGGFDGRNIKLGNDLDIYEENKHGEPHIQYCFSNFNATFGTMGDEYMKKNFVKNILKQDAMNPNGIYLPDESFDNLKGCPVKGEWTLAFTDYNEGDNGCLFDWGIMFNKNKISQVEHYQNTILSNVGWSFEKNASISENKDSILISPKSQDTLKLTYSIITDYGCTGKDYDTTFSIILKENGCLNSIDEVENGTYILYPNPSPDFIHLEMKNNLNFNLTLEIINSIGETIFKDYNSKQIDIQHLKPGIYILKLEEDNNIDYLKFIKE